MINSFSAHISTPKLLYIEDFVYILVICEARSVLSSVGLKHQLECDKVQWLQPHCGQTWISWADYYTKIFCFSVHGGAPDLIYPGTSLYEHIFCECILKKIGLTHAYFQYNSRKLVKVRFTMMYSSRKLNNKNVITTACNFWRQIACSF